MLTKHLKIRELRRPNLKPSSLLLKTRQLALLLWITFIQIVDRPWQRLLWPKTISITFSFAQLIRRDIVRTVYITPPTPPHPYLSRAHEIFPALHRPACVLSSFVLSIFVVHLSPSVPLCCTGYNKIKVIERAIHTTASPQCLLNVCVCRSLTVGSWSKPTREQRIAAVSCFLSCARIRRIFPFAIPNSCMRDGKSETIVFGWINGMN